MFSRPSAGQLVLAGPGATTATSSGPSASSAATAAAHASRSSGSTGSAPVSSRTSNGGQGHRAAAVITGRPRASQASPRTVRAGGCSPWMAETMRSTSRVGRTWCTRNTRAPSQAQMAVVASVPVSRPVGG